MQIHTETNTKNQFYDLANLPLDTASISQERLNIEDRQRTNLFPWNGQFSPQLIEVLLQEYSKPGAKVLDPFMGSGTVLYEAGRLGLSAFGSEINPAAFKFARTYSLINSTPQRRAKLISELEVNLADLIHDNLPLFQKRTKFIPAQEGNFAATLLERYRAYNEKESKHLFEAFLLLLDFQTKKLDSSRIKTIWNRFKETILELPYSSPSIQVANCDARDLDLKNGEIDLVITSPPYINVFNYHQQFRPSVEAMGWDLLEVARSEIGSNRKHRGNRLLTVTQYILDMTQVLREVCRVCKTSSRIIYVVGRESNVRKTRFLNGEIVANIATNALGLRLDRRQERVFKNRFGAMIFEDILHFTHPPKQITDSLDISRNIAKHALVSARLTAPKDCIPDFDAAIESVNEVQPSPFYEASESRAKTEEKPR